MIFNYYQTTFNWTDHNKLVLISFTNGQVSRVLKSGVALYSNIINPAAIPYNLFSLEGNTSNASSIYMNLDFYVACILLDSTGSFAHDVSYKINDNCESWYLKTSQTTRRQKLQNVLRTNNYLACPYNLQQVQINPIFSFLNKGFWQNYVLCYRIAGRIFLKNNPQHVNIYLQILF